METRLEYTMADDLSPFERYELIYVASPYSKYVWGLDQATNDIAKITGRLIARGLKVYSPIVHTHHIAKVSGIDPLDHKFWMKYDESMMNKSDSLLVVKMPGWEDSYGVNYEINYFSSGLKPIDFLNPGFIR